MNSEEMFEMALDRLSDMVHGNGKKQVELTTAYEKQRNQKKEIEKLNNDIGSIENQKRRLQMKIDRRLQRLYYETKKN